MAGLENSGPERWRPENFHQACAESGESFEKMEERHERIHELLGKDEPSPDKLTECAHCYEVHLVTQRIVPPNPQQLVN